jgi:uncharacterized protein
MKSRYNDVIKQLSDKELLMNLYATQILVLTISFILGIIFFDKWSEFFQLFKWDGKNIFLVGGSAGIAVVLIDLFFTKILPESYYDDGGINEKIFRTRNYFHIAVISSIVAISEEILFRGVLQTQFGLIASSFIFALIHIRYLFNWFLLINVVVLSFFIGFMFEMTDNLCVTIFMHFLIDFLLGVMIRKKHIKMTKLGEECS